jgi:hypothetical protein
VDSQKRKGVLFVISDKGFWDGEKFTREFRRAILFRSGGECLDAANEATRRSGRQCVASYAPKAAA